MKYLYIGLAIGLVFLFNGLQASAQLGDTDELTLEKDTLQKKVKVAFRSVDENDLLGGVSFIDVDKMTEKAYTSTSLAFVGNLIGGVNGNIWGMNDMLVVVDGMVRDANNVLPTEIDQVSILKGPSAVVLYGSRAAKGVIQITTKRGEIGEPKVQIRANTGIHVPKAYPKYLGAAEYMSLHNEASVNDGNDPIHSIEDIYWTSTGNNPYRYPDLDMYSSEYLDDFFNTTEAIAEITGGNERVKYYTSTGYAREGSLLKVGNTEENYTNRFFVRGNIDIDVAEFLKVQADANATFYNAYNAQTDWWGSAATLRPDRVAPLIPVDYLEENDIPSWNTINTSNYLIDGKYFLGASQLSTTNPVSDAYAAGNDNFVSRQFQFNTRFDLDLKSLLEGLHMRTKYGIDYASTYSKSFTNEYATFEPKWTNYSGEDLISRVVKYGDDKKATNEVVSNSSYRYTYNVSSQFDYSHTFNGDHNVFGMIVGNIWQRQISGQYHRLTNVNLGLQASYNYQHKYYLDFSAALPYSTKLPEGNRLGFSPTVTLGWRPVNESFFDNSVFDDLMLTVSGGIINHDMDIVDPDNPENEYYLYKTVLQRGGWYSWADLGGEAATEFQRGNNPEMTFVKRKELNVGLRGALLDHLLTFNFNYFMGKMDGALARAYSEYPVYFTQVGYPTSSIIPLINYNIDDRTGFDFSMYLNKKISEVDLTLGVTGTYYETEAAQRDENFQYDYRSRIGRPVNSLWGLENLGFFNDAEDLANSPEQQFGETLPGDIKYKDQNGDGVIDVKDEVYLGRWDTPLRLGLNFTAKWRNFTLFAMADGFFGGKGMKNSSYYWVSGDDKYSEIVRNRWTEVTKATATYPRLTTGSGANNFRNSDFWMYDTDRVNLSQVQLTYDLSESVFQDSFIQGASFYVSGYNLLTISKEREHLEMNVGSAPQTRFFNIGVKGTF
ncbi:SusC/RagA family TonB-linked outer membrane protein [Marinilabilia salmonicolor]|uniref:SusC/RagA family TonB-linked outer membrane protein n=1 Tax=Marinilabilia salmonicolor TaxID=989 RepID=UPI00029AA7CC|nr:SusC/RagA family TonB-linked outer membrane protein [Marinilabilia salmonicolor]